MWHCLRQVTAIITSIIIIIPFVFYFQSIFASVQAEPPTSHFIGSFTLAPSITSACQGPWPNTAVPIISETKQWNVVESETMEILSGDKVPLGDNKGATSGNLYLRHDSAQFNVSSFIDLYTCIKKDYAHISGNFY